MSAEIVRSITSSVSIRLVNWYRVSPVTPRFETRSRLASASDKTTLGVDELQCIIGHSVRRAGGDLSPPERLRWSRADDLLRVRPSWRTVPGKGTLKSERQPPLFMISCTST